MSEAFFKALNIPEPDVHLEIGSGSHAEQVGRTMIAFEKTLTAWRPDWVVVVGDVNATCACAITAKKEWIKVAHIEAGLRSFDERMPEEINRLVTDRLSDLLFTPDSISDQNLRDEGVSESRICRVGNIMIDTLEAQREAASRLAPKTIIESHLHPEQAAAAVSLKDWPDGSFALMTLHRPSNVDARETLEPLVDFFIEDAAARLPIVWAIHPRSESRLREHGLWQRVCACEGLVLVSPLGYLEMLRLNMGARLLLTDSGGLQEESCVLGTPCVTLRTTTERPITLETHKGLSRLVGNDLDLIRSTFDEFFDHARSPSRPELWDGHSAERIVAAFVASA
jgi:UDP-N-acetylglucosamine 2-epimerase (non-hydrolysing)